MIIFKLDLIKFYKNLNLKRTRSTVKDYFTDYNIIFNNTEVEAKAPTLTWLTQWLLSNSISKQTKYKYNTVIGLYKRFCDKHGFNFTIPSFQLLMVFLVYRALVDKVSYSTLKANLSAMKAWASNCGHILVNDPTEKVILHKLFLSIGKQVGVKLQDKRLPMTFDIMSAIAGITNFGIYNNVVLYTIMVVAFLGLHRLGELCPTKRTGNDPRFVVNTEDWLPQVIGDYKFGLIHLKVSKTDTYNSGVNVIIPKGMGVVDARLWMQHMIDIRIKLYNINKSYNLLAFRKGNPLFVLDNGKLVIKSDVIKFLRIKLRELGIDPTKFAGHSFRIGGATELGRRNVPSFIIKQLGRWKGPCYKRYIRLSSHQLAEQVTELWHARIGNPFIVFDNEQ